MSKSVIALAFLLQISAIACMNRPNGSKQSGVVGPTVYEGLREVFWGKKASDGRYCYFTSLAKFNSQGEFETIKETIEANPNPIAHETLLEELNRDPEAASKKVVIARAQDLVNGAIQLAPLAMLAVNHPGIQGVPEILARVLPAVFWYGSGLTFYLSGNNGKFARDEQQLRSGGQQGAKDKLTKDNLTDLKPSIQASEAEVAVIGATFDRLKAKKTNNNDLKCKDLQ